MKLPPETEEIVDILRTRTGRPRRAIERKLINLAAQQLRAAGDLLVPGWSTTQAGPPKRAKLSNKKARPNRTISLLNQELSTVKLEVVHTAGGRSSVMEVQTDGTTDVILLPQDGVTSHDDELTIFSDPHEPFLATISKASKRGANGQAQFHISDLRPTQPPIVFLVLLSEERVWCVTRSYLRDVHTTLEKHRVTGFTRAKKGLHISFAQGTNPYELDRVVTLETL